MREEIKKIFMDFLSKITDENLFISYLKENAPFLLDESGNFDEELVIENIDRAIGVLLPGLDKYDPLEVIHAFNDLEGLGSNEKYEMALLFLPSNILVEFMKYEYQNNKEEFMEHVGILREGQIEVLTELGFTYRDMLELVQNDIYFVELYKRDNSLFDEIIENHFHSFSLNYFIPMILEEYLNGGEYVVSTVLSKIGDYSDDDRRKFINRLINELVNINRFDVTKLISSLELSGVEFYKFISCITDENVMRRMIEVGGSQALIFCKDFSPEIVELADDFTYDDYKMFNGEYKDSVALLKMIAEKYPEEYPLYYCNNAALTPETAELLTKFSDETISDVGKINEKIRNNYLFFKELKKRGKYFCICEVDNLFTDVNAFNFFVECLIDGTGDFRDRGYGESRIVYYIYNKNYDAIANCYFYSSISREVAQAIIDLGFSATDYIKCFDHQEELSNLYLEQGHVEVLFMSKVTDEYLEAHSDLITYEMYLKIRETNPTFKISASLVKKFISQGHYEILNDYDVMLIEDSWDLSDVGLDNLTYEEFLKVDSVVRTVPALMFKFRDKDSTLFEKFAELFPNKECVIKEKLNSGSFTYEEFMELTKSLSSRSNSGVALKEEVALKYLKEGHLEFLLRVETRSLTPAVLDYIIDNFDLSSLPEDIAQKINYYLNNRLIDRKDYSFLRRATYLSDDMIQKIVKSGFTLDEFSKSGYDNLDYLLFYVSKENESKIIEIIKQYREKKYWGISLGSKFVVRCIEANFEIENLNYLLSVVDIRVVDILKILPKDNYDLLDQLEIKNLFVNKTVTDILLNILSVEKIKKSLAYCTDDIRLYVIKKMVNLGHNDFIDCYASGFDEDVAKKALLSGYFPCDTSLANASYRNKILKLKFNKDELDYLKTRLDNCPYLVIFFEDIMNNPVLLKSYLIKEPNLLMFFNGDLVNNVSLLYEVYQKSDALFASLINRPDITDETIINLYKTYDLDISFILAKLNDNILDDLVDKYPHLIDSYSFVKPAACIKAFENGYKLNEKSTGSIIVVAFRNGFNQPGDEKYLDGITSHDLRNLLSDINYDLFIAHKDLFLDNYFKTCYTFSYYSNFYGSDEKVSRYMNLTFYSSSIVVDTITEDEKKIVLEGLEKYGNDSKYVSSSSSTLIRLFGNDFVVKQFLDGKIHMSILNHLTINETDKDAVSLKIQKDYKSIDYTLDEKIELLSMFKKIGIYNEFVIGIYDELYELYKTCENKDKIKYVFTADYLFEKFLIDDTFDLTLIERISFYNDIEKTKKVGKRLFELMKKNKYTSDEYSSICSWLNYNNFKDECNKLAMQVFDLNPEKFEYFISNPTLEFLETIPNYLRDYPVLINRFDVVLDDKQLVIDLIDKGYTAAYDKTTDDLKNDIDVCKHLIEMLPSKILYISVDNPNYRNLLKIALAKRGDLLESELSRNPDLINDIELVKIAIVTHPNIISIVDPSLIDDSLLSFISDFSVLDFTKIDVNLFEKMLPVIQCKGLNEKIILQIFTYINQHSNEERLFSNEIVIKCIKSNIDNPKMFKQIVLLSKNKVVRDNLSADVSQIMDDALHILNNTGKINTLEKNPIFSYELVKYVYPVIGLNETINLMNYTTNANNELIRLIKVGKGEFVKNYISMLREYNMFENNDKFIHYAFRNFASIESLITEILESGRVLTDDEIGNLKKIILKNRFGIKSFSELSEYDTIMVDKINEAFKSKDLNTIKNYLSVFFGYSDISTMEREFKNFQFGNVSILKYVLNDIRAHYSEEVYNKVKITNEEMSLIVLMQKIIESNNINFLKELVDTYIVENSSDKDFCDDVQDLTAKFRLLMNYQFNARLTKLDELIANASEYSDTGVKIIEFNGESFNFLAHRLYYYDPSNAGFSQMLMNDPSLWTTLDGASTLSCSSFSDKGFHFLHSNDPNGVVYLFNELPEEFMLFMYGRDLFVEHGGHKMEPTAKENSFTDIDGLNQNSCYHSGSYNEVAGFRTGMIPCAFVCVGRVPNQETIRAAQYFSQMTGKDIPIIRFDMQLYETKRKDAYSHAIRELQNTVSVELIDACFLSGETVPIVNTTTIILNTLCCNLSQGIINEKEAIACLSELQSVINRTCLGGREADNAILALNKIAALKKTIIVMSSLSKDEIIKIETANMGESGIMYKYSEGEDTYLLKPAVDKKKNEGQAFRAEVQEAASKLQKILNPSSAVVVEAVGARKFKISKQELIDVDPNKKKYLEEWTSKGGQLDSKIAEQLMREYVIDMLLCNFDCFAGNFVIDSSGNLRGIDKEQSFRFIDAPESLKADFSYTPNGSARIPIYQYIFKRYNSGQLDISFDTVYETLDSLECLSDDDYRAIFEDYAKSLNPNNYEELLDKIVKRKHDVATNIRRYIDSLVSKKNAEEFRI